MASFAMPMYSPTTTPFGTPSHHTQGSSPFGNPNSTMTTGGYQQQHQQFFTPAQPRTAPVHHYPGRDPFAFPNSPDINPPTLSLNPSKSVEQQQPKKGYRYKAYNKDPAFRPLTSSPLAQGSLVSSPAGKGDAADLMDDDDDDELYNAHQPSSPLGRVSSFSASGSTPSAFHFTSTRRRSKTPGDEDDDEIDDDPVNPSPLFQRRKAQYKSTTSSSLSRGRRRASCPATPGDPTSSPPVATLFHESPRPKKEGGEAEDPRRAFLRERFKKVYFERATKAREKAVKARRRHVEGSEAYFAQGDVGEGGVGGKRRGKGKGMAPGSEGDEDVGMDGDESEEGEDDEQILNDELFSRIVTSMNRKEQHAYRISYAREVGSSFDPDIEDVSRWEEELRSTPASFTSPPPRLFPSSSSNMSPSLSSSTSSTSMGNTVTPSSSSRTTYRPDLGSSPPRAPTEYEYDGDVREEEFEDLEDAELEAYAEEYAKGVQEREREYGDVLEGLEGVPANELFGDWSESEGEGVTGGGGAEDVDMDMD